MNLADTQASMVYIPLDRLYAAARGGTLPDPTQGTALFADISGFTPLTEALTRALGAKRGADELARELNRVYDALVEQIHGYGGSILGFAGDAVTCWFAGDCDGAEVAAQRAAASAFAIQKAMQAFTHVTLASGDTVSLAVKVALASGAARRFLVGNPEIQVLDALAGETLTRMAVAEHVAQRGDVIADEPTLALLGKRVQVREWRSAAEGEGQFAALELDAPSALSHKQPLVTLEAADVEWVRPWLLPEVYERLQAGLGEFLLELRPVVAMFVRFPSFDYDSDPDAGIRLDTYIRWVQTTLKRYEGALLQLIIGDKGNYLYATFGAPTAHEDDARRAVNAAWELLAPPEALAYSKQAQIGISEGTMRTGAYGSETRRTYGALGDDVNLAARLMQNAEPGSILVSRRVQEKTAQEFAWKQLSPIQVKGKALPAPVARPLRKRQWRVSAVTYTGPLVGRDAELAQIGDYLAPLFDQRFAGVIYIHGEPGVGKSRIVYAARQRLIAAHSLSWFECPSDPILRQSLNPFKYMLRRYFGQNMDSPEEINKANFGELFKGLVARVRAVAHPEADSLAAELERTHSILGALVDLHWDGSLYEQLEPELRFKNTLSAFRTLIQAESLRQPVVLHLEDAHWLDADSPAMIVALMRNPGPHPFALLISARYSDDGQPIRLADIPEETPQHTLDLNVLSPEGVRALAAHTAGGEISAELARFLVEKTDGNPLFVEQLMLDLRERKLLQQETGGWTILAQATEAVPASINAVLIARLDRLAAQVKAVVQTAAVLGREFEVQILSYILKGDAYVLERVHQAEAEMIWSALSEMHYIFRHSMLRDAAYDMQLQTRLRELHALVALSIERLYAADLAPHYADLAYHYGKAGDAEHEFNYARLAGEHAAARFANQEAIQYYTQALRCVAAVGADSVETAQQRQRVHLALGELLTTNGQYDLAFEHLSYARNFAVRTGDSQVQGRACRWLARIQELRGQYPPALEWIQQGLEVLQSSQGAETAELLLLAGLIYTRQGNYEAAFSHCQRGLQISEQCHETSVLARAYNLLGHITRLRGHSNTAIEYFQHAHDLYQLVGDVNGQALANNQIANAYFNMSQWQAADRYYRLARDIFDKIGDVYNRAFTENNLGGIALNQGRLDEALAFYWSALYTLQQIGGSAYVLGVLHMNLGHVFSRRQELAEARTHLETSRDYFENAQARDFLPELYRYFAKTALRARDYEVAEAYGQHALKLAHELEMQSEIGGALRVLGEVAAAQHQKEIAESRLHQSIELFTTTKDEYESSRSRISLAQLYIAEAHYSEARALLQQCVPVLVRLGAALDLDRIRVLEEQLINQRV